MNQLEFLSQSTAESRQDTQILNHHRTRMQFRFAQPALSDQYGERNFQVRSADHN